MVEETEYESELTATREEVATVLSGVVDGILAGSIRLGDGADAISVDTPEELTLEIELETEDDELSLELELEWPHPEVEESAVATSEDLPGDEENQPGAKEDLPGDEKHLIEDVDEPPAIVGAADGSQTLARFELFRDRGDEWRWRLRHRNGNVIATSGEGYTRKHNAQKGLRSVMQNAPEAEVREGSEN